MTSRATVHEGGFDAWSGILLCPLGNVDAVSMPPGNSSIWTKSFDWPGSMNYGQTIAVALGGAGQFVPERDAASRTEGELHHRYPMPATPAAMSAELTAFKRLRLASWRTDRWE